MYRFGAWTYSGKEWHAIERFNTSEITVINISIFHDLSFFIFITFFCYY